MGFQPSLQVPVNATDSCKQCSCICFSSNVSVRNWEQRTVYFNPAENELQDAPTPGILGKLLSALSCCCGQKERQQQVHQQTHEAIQLYLTDTYQVTLEDAAAHVRLEIVPGRGIKLGQYHSLKRAAEELSKRRSATESPTAVSRSQSNGYTPVERFSKPADQKRLTRFHGTVWRREETAPLSPDTHIPESPIALDRANSSSEA